MILPKTKLSGLKICPKGPDRTESIVPGSKSTKTALGTYFPPKEKHEIVFNLVTVIMAGNCQTTYKTEQNSALFSYL